MYKTPLLWLVLLLITSSVSAQEFVVDEDLDEAPRRLDSSRHIVKPIYSSKLVLVPYRQGRKWGLADTLGQIVVVPKYDTVIVPEQSRYRRIQGRYYCNFLEEYANPISGVYIVALQGKYGLINAHKELVPCKLGPLRVEHGLFLTEDVSGLDEQHLYRRRIYNLKGELLFPEKVYEELTLVPQSMGSNKYLFVANGTPKKSSRLFIYDALNQKIAQQLLHGVGMITYEYCFQPRMIFYVYEGKDLELVFDKATRQWKMIPYKEGSIQLEQPKANAAEELGLPGNSRLSYSCYAKLLQQGEGLFIVNATQTGRNKSADTLFYPLHFDEITLQSFGISSYYRYKVSSANTDTLLLWQNYAVYKRGDKKGVITPRHLLAADFEEIILMHMDEDLPHFLVARNVNGQRKWGVISADGHYVLPCDYDSLHVYPDTKNSHRIYSPDIILICRQNNKYGLVKLDGSIVQPIVYDSIYSRHQDSYLSYHLLKAGRYGYADDDEFIPAVLPYPFLRHAWFNNYEVLELGTKDPETGEEVIYGYADHKGFLYFKEE